MSHDFLDAALRKSGAVTFKEKYVSEDSRANACTHLFLKYNSSFLLLFFAGSLQRH